MLDVFVAFAYFSVVTATSTGFGEVSGDLWYTQVLSSVQMLMAVVFTLGINNLLDENYITSRAPRGIFPGNERHLFIGLEAETR